MPRYHATPRTRIKRIPKRAVYDRKTVHGILDEALICHVGFVLEGQPYVIPTIHARVGETLYLHGSAASRMLGNLSAGAPACVTVTLVDGLVLARSTFHHSMNYRSVVILGSLTAVADRGEKLAALEAIVDHIMPGRNAEARGPNELELKATTVVKMPLVEVSAKIRSGPPVDDEEDYGLPVWAGVLPLAVQPGQAVSDPRLAAGIALPDYIPEYSRANLKAQSS